MKVVLSGGTGYVGGAVLAECLKHPSITTVLVLSRREIEGFAQNPKVRVLIVGDFLAYDAAVANEVKTADAALWCLGTYTGDEKVDIEFPLAFINLIKARPSGSIPFRFVQLSGAFTEPPPKDGQEERSLWYFQNGRRVRGAAEARVLETTDSSPQSEFSVYLVKPGAILQKGSAVFQCVLGNSLTIGLDKLTITMVDLAVNGNKQKIFSNSEIIKHTKLLGQESS